VDPFFGELKSIAVLLHFIAKELHIWGILAENEVHPGPTIGDKIDSRLRLGYEYRMVERDMHRADDADALRHGSDRSGPVNVSIRSPL